MSGNADKFILGTIAVSSGKWYWELVPTGITASTSVGIGICKATKAVSGPWIASGGPEAIYFNTGSGWNVYGTNVGGGTGTIASNNVLGVALDMDGNTLSIYKNNTLLASRSGSIDATTPHTLFFNTYNNGNFGQRAFAYTPPTGFEALNTANLPAPTIKDGSEYFNTVLWTGNGTTNHAITGVGFQPDFVWGKRRNGAFSHALFDRIRGGNKRLVSNLTNAEDTLSEYIKSFNTDGFTLGTDANLNLNTGTYVAWNWLAGGAGSSNTNGTITSTVSANPTAGFSIVTWTGNGTAGATIGHGLGVKPSFFVVKCRNLTGCNWDVYHSAYGATKHTILNGTNSVTTYSGFFNNTEPTSTLITLGSDREVNQSGATYVAYCFSEVEGYSKFGSYTGNGNANGPFVYCGFRPAWVLVKTTNSAQDWMLLDAARDTYNPAQRNLRPNQSNSEDSSTARQIDFLSNGFKIRSSESRLNEPSQKMIFAAFAEHPTGGDGVSPATAR
jgi:hypothetical protein